MMLGNLGALVIDFGDVAFELFDSRICEFQLFDAWAAARPSLRESARCFQSERTVAASPGSHIRCRSRMVFGESGAEAEGLFLLDGELELDARSEFGKLQVEKEASLSRKPVARSHGPSKTAGPQIAHTSATYLAKTLSSPSACRTRSIARAAACRLLVFLRLLGLTRRRRNPRSSSPTVCYSAHFARQQDS